MIWTFCMTVAIIRLEITSPHKHTLFLSTAIFIVVVLSNIYFILKIALVIRKHSSQIHAQEQSTQQNINMPRYRKSVNTMYYIVIGVYALCYVPFLIILLIQGIVGQVEYQNSQKLFSMQLVSSTLVMFNGVLNPIIYYWRIKELRSGTTRLLRKMWLLGNNIQEQNPEPSMRFSLRTQRKLEVTTHQG